MVGQRTRGTAAEVACATAMVQDIVTNHIQCPATLILAMTPNPSKYTPALYWPIIEGLIGNVNMGTAAYVSGVDPAFDPARAAPLNAPPPGLLEPCEDARGRSHAHKQCAVLSGRSALPALALLCLTLLSPDGITRARSHLKCPLL